MWVVCALKSVSLLLPQHTWAGSSVGQSRSGTPPGPGMWERMCPIPRGGLALLGEGEGTFLLLALFWGLFSLLGPAALSLTWMGSSALPETQGCAGTVEGKQERYRALWQCLTCLSPAWLGCVTHPAAT